MNNNQLENLFVTTLEKLVGRKVMLPRYNLIDEQESVILCSFKIMDNKNQLHLLLHGMAITVENYVKDIAFALTEENYKSIYVRYFEARESNTTYKFTCNTNKRNVYLEPEFETEYVELETGLNQINEFIKTELLRNL